jgi:formylglycine-generating enzyme required for sulfatase activity
MEEKRFHASREVRIKPNLKVSLVGVALVLAMTPRSSASFPIGQSLVIDVETLETAVDGLGRRGCQAQLGVEPGKKYDIWIAVGGVKELPAKGWEVTSRTHCGDGSFEHASRRFGRIIGIPYLILNLEMLPAVSAGRSVHAKASLNMRKFSGFDDEGRPVYARSMEKRTLGLGTDSDLVVPLLISDSRERQFLGIYEVFLRVRSRLLGRKAAATYGSIAVKADVPGAEILLDGGFVGRTTVRSPTLLENVIAGEREVLVRDFSGREAHKHVLVKKDRTTDVALAVLNLSAPTSGNDLVPIGKNPQGHEEYWRATDRSMVVRVPAGEFLMGSVEGTGEPHERPQHRVHVSEFLIDKTEVTWRQFRQYVEATAVPLPPAPVWGTPEDYAVSNVVWSEAKGYCEWVGGRLPTEAEWEKAARGADGRKYSWGNEWDPERCNSFEGGPHRPESVGSFPNCVSPFGVLDLPGSVWEWCADWYGETYYAESPSSDPKGPASGTLHVLRGASWLNQGGWLRPAYRYRGDLHSRNVHNGFRCVQDVPN